MVFFYYKNYIRKQKPHVRNYAVLSCGISAFLHILDYNKILLIGYYYFH